MVNSEEEAVRQLRQGQLAGRLREELDDILGKEERRIINAVLSQLNAGQELAPQFAIQQWLALHSVRSFKRTLEQRERQVSSAGKRMAESLTNLE